MNYDDLLTEYYFGRRRRKPRTTGPRGVPVPRTGKRYRKGHRKYHKIPLYSRPRKGGGRSHHATESGWRQGHTGPLD